jgi:hypothetical protein
MYQDNFTDGFIDGSACWSGYCAEKVYACALQPMEAVRTLYDNILDQGLAVELFEAVTNCFEKRTVWGIFIRRDNFLKSPVILSFEYV